jgi:hypothetical protein
MASEYNTTGLIRLAGVDGSNNKITTMFSLKKQITNCDSFSDMYLASKGYENNSTHTVTFRL